MFWISTGLIFLMEGVLTGLTFQSEMAVQGITHLGYPVYFGNMLMVFKILGAFVLIIPQFPARIKEWAYTGFGIDFISALVSLWVVDGFGVILIGPAVFMALLVISYKTYHKIKRV
jgi:hypothetical protein